MSDYPPSSTGPTSPFQMEWDNVLAGPSTANYDMPFNQAGIGAAFAEEDQSTHQMGINSFNPFDFPLADDTFGMTESDLPFSNIPSPFSPMTGADYMHTTPRAMLEDILSDTQQLITDPRDAPWSARLSEPTVGGAPFHIAGPRHEFMQSTFPHSFPGMSWADSGYVSVPPTDTASLVSAPCDPTIPFEDASDYQDTEAMERPAKKAKKTLTCTVPGPHRTREFANIHDLERHQRSTHGMMSTHSAAQHFQCAIKGCRNGTKWWDRKDNFRSHLVRRHFNGKNTEDNKDSIDDLVKKSVINPTPEQIAAYHHKKQVAKQSARQTTARRNARRNARSTATSVTAAEEGPRASPEAMSLVRDDYAFGGMDADQTLSPQFRNYPIPRTVPTEVGGAAAGSAGPTSAPGSASQPIPIVRNQLNQFQRHDFW